MISRRLRRLDKSDCDEIRGPKPPSTADKVEDVTVELSSFLVMELVSLFLLECLLAFVATALLYFYVNSPFDYWKKRRVPAPRIDNPFIGRFWEEFRKPPSDRFTRSYNDYPNERFVGIFGGPFSRRPTLLLRDPDLIESVLVRDFTKLSMRSDAGNSTGDLEKHLFNLGGEHWKIMRNKLTPTFSTGKLKGMHPQLVHCGESLLKYMKRLDDGRPFEIRDVISRFTMDVIASCAFGLNIDTINEPDNEFRKMGLAVFSPSIKNKIFLVLQTMAPSLMNKYATLTGKSRRNYFINSIDNTLEYRKNNNLMRQDFLHMMNEIMTKELEMVKNKDISSDNRFIFDHTSLVSNAFVFFLAGFETTATTVSYAMYELACNPEVQDHLYREVSTVLAKNNGEANHDAIQEMTYLDQVISETLRKYPPAYKIGRNVVASEYRVPGTDLVLPHGMVLMVPIHMLHHDPQYFPEPEKFVPDRFDESKDLIVKGTYLPFGSGPRKCIGERFARLEAKVCLAMILNAFKIIKCEKTVEPLTFDPNAFLLVPKNGVWVGVQPRKL